MTTTDDLLVELEHKMSRVYRLTDPAEAQIVYGQLLWDEYADIKANLGICFTPGCRTAVDRYAHCPAHRLTTEDDDD